MPAGVAHHSTAARAEDESETLRSSEIAQHPLRSRHVKLRRKQHVAGEVVHCVRDVRPSRDRSIHECPCDLHEALTVRVPTQLRSHLLMRRTHNLRRRCSLALLESVLLQRLRHIQLLVQCDGARLPVPLYAHAKDPLRLAHVLRVEARHQLPLQSAPLRCIVAMEAHLKVIDEEEQQHESARATALVEEARIAHSGLEAETRDELAHEQIPVARGLLESVEGFPQATHKTLPAAAVTLRQFHVYFLVHICVEERRRHVQLLQLVIPSCRQRESDSHRLVHARACEYFEVILAFLLSEALRCDARLVSRDYSILIRLDLVYPLAGQSVGSRWQVLRAIRSLTTRASHDSISVSIAFPHLSASGLACAARKESGVARSSSDTPALTAHAYSVSHACSESACRSRIADMAMCALLPAPPAELSSPGPGGASSDARYSLTASGASCSMVRAGCQSSSS